MKVMEPSIFEMAAAGDLQPPGPDRLNECREVVVNLDRLISAGVEMLFRNGEARRYEYRDRKTESLFRLVEENAELRVPLHLTGERREAFISKWQTRAIGIIHDTAQADTRYWGIRDPAKERYCTACYWVLPLSRFTGSQRNCDDCLEVARASKGVKR